MKRVKRIILEKLDGSFIDDFSKLKAYSQELWDTNPGSDVVINISKDALEQVVDRETTRTWKWFIELLRNSLGLVDGEGVDRCCWSIASKSTPQMVRGRLKDLEAEGEKWTENFCPYAMELYNNFKIIAQGCHVQANGDLGYDVDEGIDRHVHSSETIAPSKALVDEDETRDELEVEDEQPLHMPRALTEAKTRLKIKKLQQKPTATKKINFRGDENGVSITTNLPYSPRNMTWKGKSCVTSSQLATEKEKKISKLKTKRSKH
ncbi:hypothetical protein FXO38_10770 [Capsicum annuum]|uniref:Uncharacterized protein n=1 Tax=Capsicum annuum TaxID=4072 RepID=A0A2G2Y8C5_CAPAN|nr:hypothetical protein FXO38_10770 [Capsicum annuum]KAF3668808.1 hypothetical protein FXO37_09333 [Capsicum annuum]PHT66007.1 hypothetical protein T459_30432 [Capsicum annuum]